MSAKLGDRKNGFFKMGSLLLNREHRPHKITRLHIQEAPYYNGRRAARRANLCSVASLLSQLGLVGSKVCTRQIWLRVNEEERMVGEGRKMSRSYQCYETSYPQLPKITLLIGHRQDKPFLVTGTQRKGKKRRWEPTFIEKLLVNRILCHNRLFGSLRSLLESEGRELGYLTSCVSWDHPPLGLLLKDFRS